MQGVTTITACVTETLMRYRKGWGRGSGQEEGQTDGPHSTRVNNDRSSNYIFVSSGRVNHGLRDN